MSTSSLHGAGVLITRPRHQSEQLKGLIEQAGGKAAVVPTIEIAGPPDQERLRSVATRLNDFDIAIFISSNAVSKGLAWLADNQIHWPANLKVGAVGQATANALNEHGIQVTLVPEKYDSEGLLALVQMQNVAGKEVIIFRGLGGREHLASTLRARGADVEYAEVYERRKPVLSLAQQLNGTQREQIDVIVTTSNEGLDNLVAITEAELQAWLREKMLIVLSERGAERARSLGFRTVAVAQQASDDAILDTIKKIIKH